MRIVKFTWLKHSEGQHNHELYSLSVSPDGKRLATGGLDGKIKIWSIDTLKKYKKKIEDLELINKDNNINDNDASKTLQIDPVECRELCSMSRHAGAITCLRFSPNNRFLATGSDDKLVLIWEKDEEKTKIMQSHREISSSITNLMSDGLDQADLEHWTVRKRLVAHDNDIQDMAWAPDGSILVTVGLDRSIIIWSGTTFEKIKRFDIHQSHVKGVVFDPAGKYFATCSDDRTMRVFRYRKGFGENEMEFSVESVVRDPFKKSPLNTYYRRCSWSPDGLFVASPNGINAGISAVVIIKRGNWDSELSLIGHGIPCEVCSFSPRLYDVGDEKIETILVTAGQDRALALWSTKCATPLCVATDICLKTITDISWDPNGLCVFLSSLDGSVTSVFFDEGELGKVVSLEENSETLVRYGKDKDMFIPESVEQLILEEKAEKKFGINDKNIDRMSKLMNGSVGIKEKEKEDSNNDKESDKKPIINMLVPRSKKHPNKKMPTLMPVVFDKEPMKKFNVLTSTNQKVTVTKSGKKRVTPMLISSAGPASSNKFSSTSAPSSSSPIIKKKEKCQFIQKFVSQPFFKMPKHGVQTLVTSLRDNLQYEESSNYDNENAIDQIMETESHNSISKKRSYTSRSNNSRKKRSIEYPSYLTPSIINPFTVFLDMKSQPSVMVELKRCKDGEEQVMEVRNDDDEISRENNNINNINGNINNNNNHINSSHSNNSHSSNNSNNSNNNNNEGFEEFDSISKIVVNGDNKFQFFKNEKISNVSQSSFKKIDYWCIGTEHGSVLVFSKTGRQLRSSIELGCTITNLICQNEYLLCVTENGMVYSWDLFSNGGKCIVDGMNLSSIVNQYAKYDTTKKRFENEIKIKEFFLGFKGWPIILMNNDDVFMYDTKLNCWINLFDSWYWEVLSIDVLKNQLKKHNDRLLKIIGNRFIKSKNLTSTLDFNITDNDEFKKSIVKSFESFNDCILECFNINN